MIPKKQLFELAAALEGIPVLGTLAGSPAARAGIGYGDVVLSVNGVRTRTMLDYVEAKVLRSDGMELVVFRSGAEHVARLEYAAASGDATDAAALLAELVGMRIVGPDDPRSTGSGGSD